MPEGNHSRGRLSFGAFEVDLRTNELRKRGVRVRLQTQPFRVLEMLLERPGELVTREELKKKLWPADAFGDFDHGLNKSINKIREALGDSALNSRFVQTVARRGYRFVAEVTELNRVVATTPSVIENLPAASDQNQASAPGAMPPSGVALKSLDWKIIVGVAAVILALLLGWRWRWTTRPSHEIRSLAVLPLENLSSDLSQNISPMV